MPVEKKQMNEFYYMAHHGVQGQRKGILHGPPYPIRAGKKVARVVKSRLSKENKDKGLNIKSESTSVKKTTTMDNNTKATNTNNKETAKFSKNTNGDHKEDKTKQIIRTKNTKKLTDQQLSDAITRYEKEKRYKDLQEELYTNKGAKYLKEQLGKSVVSVLSYGVRKVGMKMVDNGIAKSEEKAKKKQEENNKKKEKAITENIVKDTAKTASSAINKYKDVSATASVFKDTVSNSLNSTMKDLHTAVEKAMNDHRSDSVIYQSGPTVPLLEDKQMKHSEIFLSYLNMPIYKGVYYEKY